MDTFLHVVYPGVLVGKLDTKKAFLTAEEPLQNAAQCPRLQAVCSHCPGYCFLGGNSFICPSLLCYHRAQLSTEVLRMQTGSRLVCSLRDGSVLGTKHSQTSISVCREHQADLCGLGAGRQLQNPETLSRESKTILFWRRQWKREIACGWETRFLHSAHVEQGIKQNLSSDHFKCLAKQFSFFKNKSCLRDCGVGMTH